jgi:hypothetical protein
MDGMRWQEIFGGMSSDLLTPRKEASESTKGKAERFGGQTPEQRRES